jgi:hypothetical protein
VAHRQLRSSPQQIDSREDNVASQQDRAIESEIDPLYDEIVRAAVRRGR